MKYIRRIWVAEDQQYMKNWRLNFTFDLCTRVVRRQVNNTNTNTTSRPTIPPPAAAAAKHQAQARGECWGDDCVHPTIPSEDDHHPRDLWSLIAWHLCGIASASFPCTSLQGARLKPQNVKGLCFFFGWGFSWLRQVWGFGVKCISHTQTLIHLYIHHTIVHFYDFGKTKRFSLYSCFSTASQLRTAIIYRFDLISRNVGQCSVGQNSRSLNRTTCCAYLRSHAAGVTS